ncbi:MAG: helix-turn-helix domain-containing protein [Candidatus Dormibacteria bacterium]
MANRRGSEATRRRTLTIEEAARELGIGRSSAYAAARAGELPALRIGRRLVIPRSALEAWLAGAGGFAGSQSPEAASETSEPSSLGRDAR